MRFRIDIPCDQEDIGQLKSALSRMNSPRPTSISKKIEVPQCSEDSFVIAESRAELPWDEEIKGRREALTESEKRKPEILQKMESIHQNVSDDKKMPHVLRINTGGFNFRDPDVLDPAD